MWTSERKKRQTDVERFIIQYIQYKLVHRVKSAQSFHKSLNRSLFYFLFYQLIMTIIRKPEHINILETQGQRVAQFKSGGANFIFRITSTENIHLDYWKKKLKTGQLFISFGKLNLRKSTFFLNDCFLNNNQKLDDDPFFWQRIVRWSGNPAWWWPSFFCNKLSV